jgi:hypothetical protein
VVAVAAERVMHSILSPRETVNLYEAVRAQRTKKPLANAVMECIVFAAAGAAVALLVAMLTQGFTLYAGFDVPGLIDLWSGGGV